MTALALIRASVIGALTMPCHAGTFEDLGVPVVKAGLMGAIVGPDERGEMTRLYFNFNQNGAPLFLVQVNPETGEARQFNSPAGPGAWGFIVGPDKRIYLGTWDGGLILRFDPAHADRGIEVAGKPAESESYIWQYTVGKDGKLYGCTYGNAKLVSYDPATGKMADLGRMDPTEDYSRSVATGADGWIYTGIGMARGSIVGYDPATGEHRLAIPEGDVVQGCGAVWNGSDGNAYGQLGAHNYRLEGGRAVEVGHGALVWPAPQRLKDGRELTGSSLEGWYELTDPATGRRERKTFTYQGAGSAPFFVGEGPEGVIYGSTAMPLEMFQYDPRTGRTENPGNPTPVGGEIYSFGHLAGKLYLCAYPGSWLSIYDPHKPWSYGTTPGDNPYGFGNMGDGHLRPRAMLVGRDGRIYVGSLPPYGQVGGALGVYDPKANAVVENYRNLIQDQAIVALAQDPDTGLIWGGSSVAGGGGAHVTETQAHLFAWDPVRREKVQDFVPVEGRGAVISLAVARGKVFALVEGPALVVYNPATDQVERVADLHGVGYPLEVSLSLWKDGLLYGLSNECIFTVDPVTCEARALARPERGIQCGWAITDTGIYFGSGVHLMRYRW
jgi:hypothetical protein